MPRIWLTKCEKCQHFATFTHAAATEMVPIVNPIPFAQWGIDLLGRFPIAKSGQYQFLIVIVDYFTKWVGVEPLADIKASNIEKFVWKSIISRFGMLKVIITDNGTQFNCKSFKEFCQKWRIDLRFASAAHPQTNGQAESANKSILSALKKKLEDKKGRWAEEIPSIL